MSRGDRFWILKCLLDFKILISDAVADVLEGEWGSNRKSSLLCYVDELVDKLSWYLIMN